MDKENYIKKFCIPILFFCSSFLVICFACECILPFLKKKAKLKIKIFHLKKMYKIIFICCLALHFYFIMYERELYSFKKSYLAYAVYTACVYIILRQINVNKKAEINLVLKDKESIGAFWAHQAYDAYYKIILENITDRMIAFEEKYNVQFLTKKLLLVFPQSCNIEGTFTQKDSLIEGFGNLEIIENDAGGNINRKFKNPVFKIRSNEDIYIVAEFSQPVSTLYRSRYNLGEEKINYIRDCYIKTLKLLLHGSPCILVIHDDVNASESLSSCIQSTIKKESREISLTIQDN